MEFEARKLLYLILTVVVLCYFTFGRRRKNYPPGPTGLPLLGNLLSLGQEMHMVLTGYGKKYGPIVSVALAHEQVVVLHGAELIKEAFNDMRFNGRPQEETVTEFLTGGMSMSCGSAWMEQRKFSLRHLREFGFGKTSMEGIILDELNELMDWIKEQNGKPVHLHRRITLCVVNTLWTILSGERYPHNEPKLAGILEQLDNATESISTGKLKCLILIFYPRIAKMFPNWSGWNYMMECVAPRRKLLQETILNHQKTFQENLPRDFIDTYLQEMNNSTDPNSIFHESIGAKTLESLMEDFILAGTHTASAALNWTVVFLMNFPDVQKRLQAEIDEVAGKNRLPSLTMKNNMPYANAFIMEVMRISSVVAEGVPHATTEDVDFHGYRIPKGTSVYSNIYSTHHDPQVWGDPENFRPERFLTSDGSKVEKSESLIPFSTGKRQCPGEILSMNLLFLFATCLAQNFTILNNPDVKATIDAAPGFGVLAPHSYNAILRDRL